MTLLPIVGMGTSAPVTSGGKSRLFGTTGWVALACVGCCAVPFLAPLIAGSGLAMIWANGPSVGAMLVAAGVIATGAVIIRRSSASQVASQPAKP